MTLFTAPMRTHIEDHYLSKSDRELAQDMQALFQTPVSENQVAKFRDNNHLFKNSSSAKPTQKRISRRGCKTIHRCL